MSLSQALERVSTHRDLVPAYFVRAKGVFIVTGIGGSHGGAMVIDEEGQILESYPSKSAALAGVGRN